MTKEQPRLTNYTGNRTCSILGGDFTPSPVKVGLPYLFYPFNIENFPSNSFEDLSSPYLRSVI